MIDIDHTLEKNKIEIEIKHLEKETKENELETAKNNRISSEIKLKNLQENLNIKRNEWVEIQMHSKSFSDNQSFSLLDANSTKNNLAITYNSLSQKAIKTYKEHETEYVENSLKKVTSKDI